MSLANAVWTGKRDGPYIKVTSNIRKSRGVITGVNMRPTTVPLLVTNRPIPTTENEAVADLGGQRIPFLPLAGLRRQLLHRLFF